MTETTPTTGFVTDPEEIKMVEALMQEPPVEMEFPTDPGLAAVVDAALSGIGARSFSGRHPELGKMLNCQVCNRRHRGAQCAQMFAISHYEGDVTIVYREAEMRFITMPDGTERQDVVGKNAFKGKRQHRRPNKWGNQLIAKTRELYPIFAEKKKPSGIFKYSTAGETMHAARKAAGLALHAALKRKKKRISKQQKLSRRINAGLVRAGKTI